MFLSYEMSRPYLLPPDVPADRVGAMKAAFAETLRDEAFLADARKAPMPIDYITGEQVADLIRRAYAAPPAVVERMRAILAVR